LENRKEGGYNQGSFPAATQWERRSQSYIDSGNGVPMNAISPLVICCTFVNTP